MKKEIELIQCYKVDGGELLIANLTKSQIKKERFYDSPIDALNEVITGHELHLRNEEHRLKNRKKIIEKFKEAKENYLTGDGNLIFGNNVDGITDICKDEFKRLWYYEY